MRTEITATMINGVPTPDVPLPIPDQTKVRLIVETIEPIEQLEPKPDPIAAWNAIEARLKLRPIYGDGKKYTRDELHERR
jgi:hypothetical protein